MRPSRILQILLPGIVTGLAFAYSCGGGGEGKVVPGISYSGLLTPAAITSENAVFLAQDILFGTTIYDDSEDIPVPSPQPQGEVPSESPLLNPLELPKTLENAATPYLYAHISGKAEPLVHINDDVPGACDGYAEVSGEVDDQSGNFDLKVTYRNYSDDCTLYLSGRTQMEGNLSVYSLNIRRVTITFGALAFTGVEKPFTQSGILSVDYTKTPYRETMTMVTRDDTTGKTYKAENYTILISEDQDDQGDFLVVDMQGRYFDPDYGYLDVATNSPLHVYLDHLNPFEGTLDLIVDSSRARVETLNQVYFRCLCDADGDENFEYDSGPIPWPWEGNDNVVISDLSQTSTDYPRQAGIAFNGGNYTIVITRSYGWDDHEIVGLTVSDTGEGGDPFLVAGIGSSSSNQDIAFDGTNFLVVFDHNPGSNPGNIMGQRVTPSGEVLDGPDGFFIADSDSNYNPSVAFDGVNYLVVWDKYISSSGYDIHGAIVSTAGEVLNKFPVYSGPREQVLNAIAFDGENLFVVWRDARNGSAPLYEADIYGARISTAGTVLDPMAIPISTSAGDQGSPDLAFDGTNFFVVWNDSRNYESPQYVGDIYGARVTREGVVLDPDGISLKTGDYGMKIAPTVDFDGTHYLVCWQTGEYARNGPAGIFAERVTTEGQLVDSASEDLGIPISRPPPLGRKYEYPVLKSGTINSLVLWANRYGSDLRGTLVPDLDQFP